MSAWTAVLLVPVKIEIEYARCPDTARAGAESIIQQKYPPIKVPDAGVPGDRIDGKIMVIEGPPDAVGPWADEEKENTRLRNLSREPLFPPIGGDDGPDVA